MHVVIVVVRVEVRTYIYTRPQKGSDRDSQLLHGHRAPFWDREYNGRWSPRPFRYAVAKSSFSPPPENQIERVVESNQSTFFFAFYLLPILQRSGRNGDELVVVRIVGSFMCCSTKISNVRESLQNVAGCILLLLLLLCCTTRSVVFYVAFPVVLNILCIKIEALFAFLFLLLLIVISALLLITVMGPHLKVLTRLPVDCPHQSG